MVGLAENKATQPSLAGAWAELGKKKCIQISGHPVGWVHDLFRHLESDEILLLSQPP